MLAETHVVTIGVQFEDGKNPAGFTCEVYRGDAEQCWRFMAAMGATASHDQRVITQTHIHCGTIEAWETWLRT